MQDALPEGKRPPHVISSRPLLHPASRRYVGFYIISNQMKSKISIDDWDVYFNKTKTILEQELHE